jgi:uncharacterized protein YeaO (DUF488 family)
MPAGRRGRFEVRRIYDADPADGAHRVLVDRLWPRGIAKAKAPIDEWAKDLAPSTELRRWYGHEPDKYDEFARRYRQELRSAPGRDEVARLRSLAKTKRVALITATRDVEHSAATVLKAVFTS